MAIEWKYNLFPDVRPVCIGWIFHFHYFISSVINFNFSNTVKEKSALLYKPHGNLLSSSLDLGLLWEPSLTSDRTAYHKVSKKRSREENVRDADFHCHQVSTLNESSHQETRCLHNSKYSYLQSIGCHQPDVFWQKAFGIVMANVFQALNYCHRWSRSSINQSSLGHRVLLRTERIVFKWASLG